MIKKTKGAPTIGGFADTSASIIEVLKRASFAIGATVLVEPEWGCVGQIVYASGVKRYFRLSTLDLNTMGASEIARDKGFSRFFLSQMGYPIAQGETFLSPKWARMLGRADKGGVGPAWRYASSIGLPVFVKPNSLSRGVGVSKATSKSEFYAAIREAMRHDKVVLVEKTLVGRDYRFVVLDGAVISAYERLPLSVVGDSHSAVRDLIARKQESFRLAGRDTTINTSDPRLLTNLTRADLSLESVPHIGQDVRLFDHANLSAGGSSLEVTSVVHTGFQRLAVAIARDMGLRLAGVDFIIDGDAAQPPVDGSYWVLEVNSAPGLDHYAAMGEEQKRIVDRLYAHVVKAMERPGEHTFV